MLERNKFLSGRRIRISSFSKKTERGPLKICNNTSTVEQWVLKETWFCLQQIFQKTFGVTLSLLNFEYFLCWALYLYSWTAISSTANIMIQTTWGTWGLAVSSAMDEPIPLLMTITRHGKATGCGTLQDTMKSTPHSRERHSSINSLQTWSSATGDGLYGHSSPGHCGGTQWPHRWGRNVTATPWSMQAQSLLSAKQERLTRQTTKQKVYLCLHTTATDCKAHSHSPWSRWLLTGGGRSTHRVTWGTKCFLQTLGMIFPH